MTGLAGQPINEPFYYDGIPDEELHSHLNNEFEKVINLKKYDVAFLTKNLLYDDGGGYVLIFDPYIRCIVPSQWFGHFSGAPCAREARASGAP